MACEAAVGEDDAEWERKVGRAVVPSLIGKWKSRLIAARHIRDQGTVSKDSECTLRARG